MGSGVLIIDATRGIVLTAAHVVSANGMPTICDWHDGSQISGRVTHFNRQVDVAVILLDSKPSNIKGAELRGQPIRQGEPVVFLGYSRGRDLTIRETSIRGYIGMSGVANASSNPGMSGGPVIDARGRVIGPLWGSGMDRTAFVTVAGRRTVLTADYCDNVASPRLRKPFPESDWDSVDNRPNVGGEPRRRVNPSPRQKAPWELDQINARLDDLFDKIAALELKQGAPGKDGHDGEPGRHGKDGNDGRNGRDANQLTNQEVKELARRILPHLPPINFVIHGTRGSEPQPTKLGERIDITSRFKKRN
jgi:hypothetical protein